MNESTPTELEEIIKKEKSIIKEIASLMGALKITKDIGEKRIISSQLKSLKSSLRETNENVSEVLNKKSITKPLTSQPISEISEKPAEQISVKSPKKVKLAKEMKLHGLEKETLKRLKKKEKKVVKQKTRKPSGYIKMANKIFFDFSTSVVNKKIFDSLKKDLVKTNLQIIPAGYISLILFTTLLSAVAGLFAFSFFLFFNLGAEFPFITKVTENLGTRFLKVFWILFIVPLGTFFIMYIYPSLERKSTESRINQELPFATIHMSAISGSMVEPSKIFSIIISTTEYPYLEKEFTKLINKINIQGYDFVSALRSNAINSPSTKLSELFNGLATTINSGGSLRNFFDKRSESLLFDYKITREKQTKSAETFMDIYISVVVAAPMILMLLLMMMKISGLGLSLSASMISLIMVLGVSMINILFLVFLHLKQPSEG